jgi:hypothetical protein
VARPAELSLREISALVGLLDQGRPGEAEQRSRLLVMTYPNSGTLWKVLSVAQLHHGTDALDFIRLSWDPNCLDFHHTERIVSNASTWQVRQEISFASARRWRNREGFLGPLRHLMALSAGPANART